MRITSTTVRVVTACLVALGFLALQISPAQAAPGTSSVHYYSTAAGDLKAKGSTYASADGSTRIVCAESLSSGYATVRFAVTYPVQSQYINVTDYAGGGNTCVSPANISGPAGAFDITYKVAYFTAAGSFVGDTAYFTEAW